MKRGRESADISVREQLVYLKRSEAVDGVVFKMNSSQILRGDFVDVHSLTLLSEALTQGYLNIY